MDQLSEATVVKVPKGVATVYGASIEDVEAGVRLRNPKLALGLPILSGKVCSDHLPEEVAADVVVPDVDPVPDPDRGLGHTDVAVEAIHIVDDPVCRPNGVVTMKETIPGAAVGEDGHEAPHRIILLAVVLVQDRDRDRYRAPADHDHDLCPVLLLAQGTHPIMNIVVQRSRQREKSFTWVD